MPSPVNRATAEHYLWGQGCDGWRLLQDPQLSVIQEQMPPGTAEVRHFHRAAQQFFYVLAGEARMEVNGETFPLPAGEGIHIPAGVPHQIWNESPAPVQFLVISQPASQGDRVPAPQQARQIL
ncbi:MAG: cupin domain-containing protein [Acidobacteria bacterium]|jgi:mannose-6-phosphate isomerase-like protein (cupin superfamily)|nr:cupin domain-containing protein [Acidobacteriota bacterium]